MVVGVVVLVEGFIAHARTIIRTTVHVRLSMSIVSNDASVGIPVTYGYWSFGWALLCVCLCLYGLC